MGFRQWNGMGNVKPKFSLFKHFDYINKIFIYYKNPNKCEIKLSIVKGIKSF